MRVVVVTAHARVATAHRQALAAHAAGAEVHVLVLHRGGALGAAGLALHLRRLRRRFPYELVHAHDGAGDAVRRARPGAPVVVSVEGEAPATVVHARAVLADSAATAARCAALGTRAEVVHLGLDLPPRQPSDETALVTVAPLVPRARHADVLRALWLLRDQQPDVRWDLVGDGPERAPLARLAADLGLDGRVRFVALPRAAGVFVLPSLEETSATAYLEAMAGGVPAIGCRGEPGPEEVAAAGPGLRLVAPGDPEALASELGALLEEPGWRRELGAAARATVEAAFSWEQCGRATVAAYERALAAS